MFFMENLEETYRHFTKTGGFLTTQSEGRVNTMTISWGFIGFIWGKPAFIVAVRPQRHTFGIIEKADSFTVSIPYGTMREELSVCGSKSGRDIDKSAVVTFTPAKSVESPVISGCDVYYECKIQYADFLEGGKLPEPIRQNFYKDDYHKFYFGEIVEAYRK